MKPSKIDWLLVILAVLLLLGMACTLCFQANLSRHGYGEAPVTHRSALSAQLWF